MKSLEELAEELGINHAELLQNLEELEKEGLATRLVDEVTGQGIWFATEVLNERHGLES